MNSDLAKLLIENHLKQKKIDYTKEYKFLDNRKFRIDYYIKKYKLAIEFEGGVWTGGRHNRVTGFIKDIEKYNLIALSGIWLLRVTTGTVADGSFLKTLDDFFLRREKRAGL